MRPFASIAAILFVSACTAPVEDVPSSDAGPAVDADAGSAADADAGAKPDTHATTAHDDELPTSGTPCPAPAAAPHPAFTATGAPLANVEVVTGCPADSLAQTDAYVYWSSAAGAIGRTLKRDKSSVRFYETDTQAGVFFRQFVVGGDSVFVQESHNTTLGARSRIVRVPRTGGAAQEIEPYGDNGDMRALAANDAYVVFSSAVRFFRIGHDGTGRAMSGDVSVVVPGAASNGLLVLGDDGFGYAATVAAGNEGRVFRFPVAASGFALLNDDPRPYVAALALRSSGVVWVERVPAANNTYTTALRTHSATPGGPSSPLGSAVAAVAVHGRATVVGDALWYAVSRGGSTTELRRTSLTTGADSVVLSDPRYVRGFVVDARHLYWSSDGLLERVPLSSL